MCRSNNPKLKKSAVLRRRQGKWFALAFTKWENMRNIKKNAVKITFPQGKLMVKDGCSMRKMARGRGLLLGALGIASAAVMLATPAFAEETVATVEETYYEETTEVPEEFDLDNDELFAMYFNSQLSPGMAAFQGSYSVGDNLTGNDWRVYNVAKAAIAQIANGTVTDTQITLNLSDFDLDTATYYDCAALGVSSIGHMNATTQAWELTKEATDAMNAKLNYSLSKVVNALLVDCPYEFYWYNKTDGGGTSAESQCSYSISYQGNEAIALAFGSNSQVTISFSVANDYQKNGARYETDPQKTQAAANTVANATAIVTAHKNESDYQKLISYRDAICGLVSYNEGAAASNYDGGYGDPWQLVYVFDNDPTTKVVCEGYSKAFQYLCDLSSFKNQNLYCYTVTGKMAVDEKNGEDHMWNIVTFGAGDNYLVDVTNCDDKTVGYQYELFLRGNTADLDQTTHCYTFRANDYAVHYWYATETLDEFSLEELTLTKIDRYVQQPAPVENRNIIYGNSLLLEGQIGINYYLILSDPVNTAVRFVVNDVPGNLIPVTEEYKTSVDVGEEGDPQQQDMYCFTYSVAAKNMNDTVTLQLYDANGQNLLPLFDNNGLDYTSGYEYSVMEFARRSDISGSTELKNLANSMANYGAYAQLYFNYGRVTETAEMKSAIATVGNDALNSYAGTITQENTLPLRYYASSLILDEKTSLCHYFTLADGANVDMTNCTFSYYKAGDSANKKTLSLEQRRGMYVVEIPNIAASELGTPYVLEVAYDGSVKTTINYSALSYGHAVLRNSSKTTLRNLVKALYLYNAAANAYFNPAANTQAA